jgi:hypothetical protein
MPLTCAGSTRTTSTALPAGRTRRANTGPPTSTAATLEGRTLLLRAAPGLGPPLLRHIHVAMACHHVLRRRTGRARVPAARVPAGRGAYRNARDGCGDRRPRAPIAVLMTDFLQALRYESRQVPYPVA